ncbi:MAG: methyltransferase domain-containing protein [Paracoccaceae bacterium]|nr:methyltransferase domain-containing protein [Paracoccaceae bacterium]
MARPPELTDRPALARNRARADDSALFLHEEAAVEIKERLSEVNRSFKSVAIVTGFKELWQREFPDAVIVPDDDVLALEIEAYDLVIHALALHWANDPVGQLVQCRRALKPDGLFLSVLFGGQTLAELRAALAEAEALVAGGISPRVLPMGEIRELGGLLQRAGFALPVADSVSHSVTYANMTRLMQDLRAMGEGNALTLRRKAPTQRRLFEEASRIYSSAFAAPGDLIRASFEMIFLTGWAPHDSQQKPLRPGSAVQRLADALQTAELPIAPRSESGTD